MRKQIAAGNWKMNTLPDEGENLVIEIVEKSKEVDPNVELIVCPPFTHLSSLLRRTRDSRVMVGAQNCFWETSGAYTGEVSVDMLKELGVSHVIIGHSERREYFTESDEILLKKVKLVLHAGLTPIFCIGERLEDREHSNQFDVVKHQMANVIFMLSESEIKKVVVAYEPVWAIGTGRTATPEQAQKMHAFIREAITVSFNTKVSSTIPILYGGSVKGANAKEIFSMPDVDGGLIGGASLSAAEFIQIAKSF
ncbi:MAG TPA: triose-phosphate isomerase [Williamwhitmania sp.]|nr:triose-phosphate isomerase [Williamwhitmania sp.]